MKRRRALAALGAIAAGGLAYGSLETGVGAELVGEPGGTDDGGTVGTATPTPAGAATSESWDAYTVGRAAHAAVNAARRDAGVGSLSWDDELYSIARDYAVRMAEEGFFSHTDPDGNDFSNRYAAAGYECRVPVGDGRYATGAENLAQTYWDRRVQTADGTVLFDTPRELGEGLVQQWLASPGHRENLLTEYWRREAVGVAKTAAGQVYAVQNFC